MAKEELCAQGAAGRRAAKDSHLEEMNFQGFQGGACVERGIIVRSYPQKALKHGLPIVLKAESQSLPFPSLFISSFIISHFFPSHLLNLSIQESTEEGPLHCLSSLLSSNIGGCRIKSIPYSSFPWAAHRRHSHGQMSQGTALGWGVVLHQVPDHQVLKKEFIQSPGCMQQPHWRELLGEARAKVGLRIKEQATA